MPDLLTVSFPLHLFFSREKNHLSLSYDMTSNMPKYDFINKKLIYFKKRKKMSM